MDEHPGRKVLGKARHRDPVRSPPSYIAFRWGHTWVVVAVLIRFPFSRRLWALSVRVARYRSESDNAHVGRRPKTPAQLARQLIVVLLRWFPSGSSSPPPWRTQEALERYLAAYRASMRPRRLRRGERWPRCGIR